MRPDVLSRKIVASPLLARSDELPQRTLPSIHNNSTAHLRCRRPVARRLSAFHAAITIAVLTGILLLALSYNSKRNLTFGDEAIGQLSPGGNKDKNTGKRLTSWTFDALLPLMQHGESNDDGSFSDSSRAAPYQPPGSSSAPITPSPKVADETSSPVAERYEESGKGKYRIPSNELDDVFLRRPNWRRADTQRRSYSFSLTDPSPFPYDDGKQRFGKSHFSFEGQEAQRGNDFKNDEEDADIIRVLIVIFSNRLDAQTCSMVASAYLSGLPIVVLGDGHVYNNFTDKHYETLKMVRKAGLRPQDVVVVLDADMLFASGPEFVRSVDRFIRYSPASEAELSVQDVRDDYGDMIAPVFFAGENYCKYPDTFGKTRNFECTALYRARTLRPFDEYMQRTFPLAGRHRSVLTVTAPHLNAGSHLSRVWAFDKLMEGFSRFTEAMAAPWPARPLVGSNTGWTCDQSVLGELLMYLLHWEVDVDIFTQRKDNKILESKLWGTRPTLKAPGPFGLPLGLLGVDFYNELFFVVSYRNTTYLKLNDRYWQPRSGGTSEERWEASQQQQHSHAEALRAETARVFALSYLPKAKWREAVNANYSGREESLTTFTLAVSHVYFAPRLSAHDGIDDDERNHLSLRQDRREHDGDGSPTDPLARKEVYVIRRRAAARLNRCHIEALLRANVHLHRTKAAHAAVTGDGDLFGAYFEECLQTARDNDNNNNNSAAWPGLLPTDAVPFFTVQPLPRSRHPNITSILTAPLVLSQPVLHPHESSAWWLPVRNRYNASETFQFPSVVHYAGLWKDLHKPTMLPSVSWGIPLYFEASRRDQRQPGGDDASDGMSGIEKAKRLLYAMPLELWGSNHRSRRNYVDVCSPHIEEWLVNWKVDEERESADPRLVCC